jgi:hypothetical protein
MFGRGPNMYVYHYPQWAHRRIEIDGKKSMNGKGDLIRRREHQKGTKERKECQQAEMEPLGHGLWLGFCQPFDPSTELGVEP